MKRLSMMMFAAMLAVPALFAQSSAVGELRTSYEGIKNTLLKAAEAVPDEDLSFKPTPEQRTLGALIGHIADAGTMYCTAAMGKMQRASAEKETSKEVLIAALKTSFENCDKAFAMSDEAAAEKVPMGRMGSRSKLGFLIAALVHDNEEYGYMAVYLRLKGITPPTSMPRK